MTFQNKKQTEDNHDASHHDLDLRGTLYSVLTIGAIFILLWFICFIMFLVRM